MGCGGQPAESTRMGCENKKPFISGSQKDDGDEEDKEDEGGEGTKKMKTR
jgi:hypothetical protein